MTLSTENIGPRTVWNAAYSTTK